MVFLWFGSTFSKGGFFYDFIFLWFGSTFSKGGLKKEVMQE